MSSSSGITPQAFKKQLLAARRRVEQLSTDLEQAVAELKWLEEGRRFVGSDVSERDDSPTQSEKRLANGKPPLRDAILRIMRERPTSTWPARKVIDELAKRNWLPDGKNAEHITRSRLADMQKKGQLRRVDRGRYRLPPDRVKA